MKSKLLTIKDYFDFFSFQEYDTGCGIEQEPESNENFLWAQTFLPKGYFPLDHQRLIFNPLLRSQLEDIPDQVHVKFELFGIGSMNNVEAFIFKPWVVNVDNPMLFQLLENFHLFVPSTLFYNLIERLVFLEQINSTKFKYLRILEDIPANTFQRFGLDRPNTPNNIKLDKFEISRISEVDTTEIMQFYSDNWESITPQLKNNYFRPLLNTWFRLTILEENNQWLQLKKTSTKRTIGFLRLYNTNSSFTGGTSLEYIIDKNHRNKGYATKASLALINHLKKYSYAISLGAEVKDNNTFSKRVLKRLGFKESETSTFNGDNFELSLFDDLELLEDKYDKNEIKFSVLNKYANKYSRYF